MPRLMSKTEMRPAGRDDLGGPRFGSVQRSLSPASAISARAAQVAAPTARMNEHGRTGSVLARCPQLRLGRFSTPSAALAENSNPPNSENRPAGRSPRPAGNPKQLLWHRGRENPWSPTAPRFRRARLRHRLALPTTRSSLPATRYFLSHATAILRGLIDSAFGSVTRSTPSVSSAWTLSASKVLSCSSVRL